MASGFNLGQDATVDIQGSDGSDYSFDNVGGDLMSFDWDPVANLVEIKPISNNGYEKRRIERTAYKGTIGIGRINSDFEQMEANAASNYHQGLPDITYTISLRVRDQDGTGNITNSQFSNCTVWMSKGPNFKMGDPTAFTVEFKADDYTIL